MTSSKRAGIFRNTDIKQYKSFDSHCEPGLFSILFLACGRHKLTSATLESLCRVTDLYDGEVEYIFLEQGNGTEADANIQLFRRFECERKSICLLNDSYGINIGFNNLYSLSRGEFCIEMENDWLCQNPSFNFLATAKEIFSVNKDIGIVQLRSAYDPWENFGIGKSFYNPWSCSENQRLRDKVEIWSEKLPSGHEYWVGKGFYGYNHNPMAIRKNVYRQCGPLLEPIYQSDPRHGEEIMQERIKNSHWLVSHINTRGWEHIGGYLRKYYEKM